MELISMVIPAYNEEATIGDDLDTIIRAMEESSYKCEITVVDDGSADGTTQIVARFETDTWNPQVAGLSEDGRDLGIMLDWVKVEL